MQVFAKTILLIVVYLSLSSASFAESAITGKARVHDGDTFRIGKKTIRLWGIDAVELHQMCGKIACGTVARQALENLIGNDDVTCIPKGQSHKRIVATCHVRGKDIAGMMARAGMAFESLRYSEGFYTSDEKVAKAAQLGIWAMDVQDPAAWRACQRKGGCTGDMTRTEFLEGFTPMGGRIAPFDAAYDAAYTPRVRERGVQAVNRVVNALPYHPDTEPAQALNVEDFWIHGGDCDKYALIKMLELRAQGQRGMAYVVFRNGPKGDAHAVLAVPENGVMMALDNRYTDPVPLAVIYRDYTPAYFVDVDSRVLWRAAGM